LRSLSSQYFDSNRCIYATCLFGIDTIKSNSIDLPAKVDDENIIASAKDITKTERRDLNLIPAIAKRALRGMMKFLFIVIFC